ncbi:cytochrome P450 [Streptomyces sp. 5-10]|uniref:cytochrome P450 family protein n=1 Tax=Streptomyces sp. 5-10 TaxID=878925 RepID=UPI00168BC039|nr:cytochrome P450 [Streptomyces sp. 5-10]MBD3009887.1 cytochrome P450 [Streptomyces sp. 5-10]
MTQSTVEVLEELGPEFYRDPYPFYARLRERGPVVRVGLGPTPVWLVVGYTAARAALSDPRLVKDQGRMARAAAATAGVEHLPVPEEKTFGEQVLTSHLLTMDPPDHTRLRTLVGKAFTMRRIQALRPRIEQVIDELLDAVAGQTELDLLETLAYPLPVTVLGELLGVPAAAQPRFKELCNALNFVGPEEMRQVGEDLAELVLTWVELRRTEPADDLLTELVRAHDLEDRLTLAELASMVFQVMSAGFGPTSHLIGNGVSALVRHPEQLEMVRADRSLVPAAVDEIARYDTTVHIAMPSVAAEPFELGGALIAENDFVVVSPGAANRDPAYRADPDVFDVRGDTAGHLGFGHGIHHCLGTSLGKIQAEAALTALLDRYERIELAVPAEELQHKVFPARLLEALPLRVG